MYIRFLVVVMKFQKKKAIFKKRNMAYNLRGEFHYNTEDIDGGKGGILLRLGDEISMPT